jgi:hypothetical protein
MVERVVFLVSRVEGAYEFEVQPLREYFAARYLYETAPYSPTGAERRGTKPDRFDALARNFYWLNVTRFFAGCFSKGELPALVDRLSELAAAEGYKNTTHPRRLTAMLLADWVFSQHQKSTQQAVEIVLDELSIGHLFNRRPGHFRDDDEAIILPEGSGRRELVDAAFRLLRKAVASDYAFELCSLISLNGLPEEIDGVWLRETEQLRGEKRERYFRYGLYLGSLGRCSDTAIHELLTAQNPTRAVLLSLLEANKVEVLYANPQWCEAVVEQCLDGEQPQARERANVLSRFAAGILSRDYAAAFLTGGPEPLGDVVRRRRHLRSEGEQGEGDDGPDFDVLQHCRSVVQLAEKLMTRRASDWVVDLAPWEELVEECRRFWGERWQLYTLANIAGGIRNSEVKCSEAPELWDRAQSLCRRARYARLRIGSAQFRGWWDDQRVKAESQEQLVFLSLLLWTWATFGAVLKVRSSVEAVLGDLSEEQFGKVVAAVSATTGLPFRRESSIDVGGLPTGLSPRFVTLLGARVRRVIAYQLYQKYLRRYRGSDSVVSEFAVDCVAEMALREHRYWPEALKVIQAAYKKGIVCDVSYARHHHPLADTMPFGVAQAIARDPNKFPRDLAHLAADRCRMEVANGIVPLGNVALQERWFEVPPAQSSRAR